MFNWPDSIIGTGKAGGSTISEVECNPPKLSKIIFSSPPICTQVELILKEIKGMVVILFRKSPMNYRWAALMEARRRAEVIKFLPRRFSKDGQFSGTTRWR